MTKDEIRALISAKVAGQGDQVDAGGALAQILDGIVDAIPEPVSVPDWVAGVPVIEGIGQISEEDYNRIIKWGAVVYQGNLFTLCTDINTASRYVANHSGLSGSLFVNCFVVDDGTALDTMHGLTICIDSQGGYAVNEDDL